MPGKTAASQDDYLVAIGASAGGLEAIHEFFDHMPERDDISYIVIQHLSPDHKSLLVELVGRHTNMKVYEAGHNVQISKNCIYVIPNNKFITIQNNKLILSEKLQSKVPNNAIDVFMYSLAREKKDRAISVILSGTGTDGTKGIASIKEEGGLVIAQDPGSSKFDGMPNSAIASGNVDYVLSPEEIPQQIISYLDEADWSEEELDDSIDDKMLQQIFSQIQTNAGFDFHYYKTPTITRRVFQRMRKGHFDSVEAYYNFLKDNVEECKLLGKDFLINVTRFFRDTEAFEELKKDILPAIIRQKEKGDQIKIWICACSTGEEAYSLAILLDEVLEEMDDDNLSVKIFATDIEKSNIEIASKGIYPKSIADDVSPERLRKYFSKGEQHYTINSRIRKQIVFAAHNVIKDPPLIKNDLVSCRNMLIYMNTALQKRVYSVLLFSALRGGYLFLGTTENPNFIRSNIEEINGRWKIYRKISDLKLTPFLPEVGRRDGHAIDGNGFESPGRTRKRPQNLWDDFKDTLLSDFNFAAFYIDRSFEIKEAVGNFDSLLSLPKKTLKLNLLRMLPPNISTILIGEIKKSWLANDKKMINNLHYQSGAQTLALQVMIRPSAGGITLVAFHFMKMEKSIPALPQVPVDAQQSEYLLSLEEELNETKGSLQHAIEDLETANEELQSTNEELLSSNEELQSSNEELQSLNEELHTLNTEHQLKINELIELNDDLNNYFRSSNIGQVFLDKNMIIRKFNPASARMINFIDSDIGRPITHISTNVKYQGLIDDVESVLKTHATIEKEVQLYNGMNLLLRIMPYIRQDQKISGAVISFIDITTITNLNNIIRGVFNSSISSIVALACERNNKRQVIDFSVVAANLAGEKLLGRDIDNLKGKLVRKDLKLLFIEMLFAQLIDVVNSDSELHTDCYVESEKIWLEITAVKMEDGVVATFTDITQKKNAEDRLKKNYVELVSTKENLKKLNNELEVKVSERTQLLSASEERFRLVARATNDMIRDWDIVNNVMWFGESFYSKFGYDAAEPFDRNRWIERIHPEDRTIIAQSVQNAINNGDMQWSGEYRFLNAAGEYMNILDRAYVLQDSYGTPFRMLASMLDLTDLKKAEREIASNIEQRKFLVESMPLIVWTATRDGKVDFVNNQFEVYTGVRNIDALQEGWKTVIHKEDLRQLERHWTEAVQSRKDFQMEARVKLSDGSYHWNIMRARARKDDQNEVVNWVITTIDIHDQKQLNEVLEHKVEARTQELVKMNEALETSNNDLQQFASVASHDLQEPLRKIHLYASRIRERNAGAFGSGMSHLDKILQSSTRMKSIINNILNYSKLSADNVNFEPTDVNKLIREILDDLEISIQEKKAEIFVDEFPEIETIPGQMSQVFQNMIGNAMKFSRPDAAPIIRITVDRIASLAVDGKSDKDGDFCKITIRDNGIGFNSKFTQDIFVLFQRLHSKDAYEGTGIGLAIAKKIIDKHHGLITASSKENAGATFTIVLPVKQSKD